MAGEGPYARRCPATEVGWSPPCKCQRQQSPTGVITPCGHPHVPCYRGGRGTRPWVPRAPPDDGGRVDGVDIARVRRPRPPRPLCRRPSSCRPMAPLPPTRWSRPCSAPGERPVWFPGPLGGAPQVVLLALDGLGWRQLQDRCRPARSCVGPGGGTDQLGGAHDHGGGVDLADHWAWCPRLTG